MQELGIVARTGNDQLDDDIGRDFMNVQGSLVGCSMVGHLRSMNIKVQRDRVRACIK